MQIALYFSWLSLYTKALLFLSVFGVVTMATQPPSADGGVNANPLTLAYSVRPLLCPHFMAQTNGRDMERQTEELVDMEIYKLRRGQSAGQSATRTDAKMRVDARRRRNGIELT
eukprot:SAG11_NODE_193_length_12862_cov_7.128888_12_plen_114_part_00